MRDVALVDEEKVKIPLGYGESAKLDILVENMGRINFGPVMFKGDRKGILDGIYGSDRLMTNFKVFSYKMNTLDSIEYQKGVDANLPAFFKGNFEAEEGKDCFVRFDSFKKGLIWINGFMLGRYWEIGPQEALYIPGSILHNKNEIVVFETDGLRGLPVVEITNRHGLVGKTH
jgi:beta-galactosidase